MMKKTGLITIFIIVILLLTFNRMRNTPHLIEVGNVSSSSLSQSAPTQVIAQKEIKDNQLEHESYTDFDAQLDLDLKSLPTMDDLQNLTQEEVHHTPEIMKNGGERIGKIHDQAQSDPTKRVSAMSFFKSCAEDKEIATALRAVCLSKLYKLIPVWRIPVPLSQENISDEVSDLALRLP